MNKGLIDSAHCRMEDIKEQVRNLLDDDWPDSEIILSAGEAMDLVWYIEQLETAEQKLGEQLLSYQARDLERS